MQSAVVFSSEKKRLAVIEKYTRDELERYHELRCFEYPVDSYGSITLSDAFL